MSTTSLPDESAGHAARPALHRPRAVFAREQERIFEPMWFARRPLAATWPTPARSAPCRSAGRAILVTRAADGEVRAFFNVCRHRGAQLCTWRVGAGRSGSLRCPYHAWTYDLDGKLIAAPNLTKMPDVDRVEYGLRRVARARVARLRLGVPGRRAAVVRATTCMGAVVDPARRPGLDRPLRRGQPRGRPADPLRRAGQLEADRRELHGVLPLRDDPPRTRARCCRSSPTGTRRSTTSGTAREFGERIEGFTVDGSAGLATDPDARRRAGPPLLRGHHPAAGLRQPGARPRDLPPDVPAGRRPHHRRVRLAVPARGGRRRASTSTASVELFDRVNRQDFDGLRARASRRCRPGSTRDGGVLVPSEHHIGDFHDWLTPSSARRGPPASAEVAQLVADLVGRPRRASARARRSPARRQPVRRTGHAHRRHHRPPAVAYRGGHRVAGPASYSSTWWRSRGRGPVASCAVQSRPDR